MNKNKSISRIYQKESLYYICILITYYTEEIFLWNASQISI